MGAAGSGKSTTAEKVSFELKRIYKNRPAPVFIEGDDHHPPENKAKMSQGIPLDDTIAPRGSRQSRLPSYRLPRELKSRSHNTHTSKERKA